MRILLQRMDEKVHNNQTCSLCLDLHIHCLCRRILRESTKNENENTKIDTLY